MDILDPDRIAELVEAAKDGQLPEAAATPVRRAARLRTVDFSRPTKFGADQQRRMNRATETFCQTANTRLSSELRWPVEFEVLSNSQLTWAAAQGQIPAGSLLAVLELQPIGTQMLLTIERSFVLVCLECLLGGAPERPARDRRLSEIDWSLAENLIASLVQPLALVWQELGGVELQVGEIGPNETAQVASVSEPTFSTFIEARINQQSYALGLLIPWASIEPIEAAISGRSAVTGITDAPVTTPMGAPLATVPVTVRAEVAHVELHIEQILQLAPGSLIEFDAAAEDGVDVYADAVHLGRARPGREGRRRAVQLLEFSEEMR